MTPQLSSAAKRAKPVYPSLGFRGEIRKKSYKKLCEVSLEIN